MPTPPNGQTHSNNSSAVVDKLFEFDYLVGLMLKGLVYARDICDLHFWSMIPIPTYILINVLQHMHHDFKKKIVYKTLFFLEFTPL